MGCFSWVLSDSGKTLVNKEWAKKGKKFDGSLPATSVTILLPNGQKFSSDHYDGYGKLMTDRGELDIFTAVYAAMQLSKGEKVPDTVYTNHLYYDTLRKEAFEHYEEVMDNVKLVADPSLNFDDVGTSSSADSQGCFAD